MGSSVLDQANASRILARRPEKRCLDFLLTNSVDLLLCRTVKQRQSMTTAKQQPGPGFQATRGAMDAEVSV